MTWTPSIVQGHETEAQSSEDLIAGETLIYQVLVNKGRNLVLSPCTSIINARIENDAVRDVSSSLLSALWQVAGCSGCLITAASYSLPLFILVCILTVVFSSALRHVHNVSSGV